MREGVKEYDMHIESKSSILSYLLMFLNCFLESEQE